MGFIKRLFGGAESIREAMRESYVKHFRLAQARGDDPHAVGLYGALGSRYRVSGRNVPEPELWAELAPFLAMAQSTAVAMLAEYVVVQEAPQQANIPLLAEAINSVAQSGFTEEQRILAIMAFLNRAPWCKLLSPELFDELRLAAAELEPKNRKI